MTMPFTITVTKRTSANQHIFIAEVNELPVASFGDTREESIVRVQRTLASFLEALSASGGLDAVLERHGTPEKSVQSQPESHSHVKWLNVKDIVDSLLSHGFSLLGPTDIDEGYLALVARSPGPSAPRPVVVLPSNVGELLPEELVRKVLSEVLVGADFDVFLQAVERGEEGRSVAADAGRAGSPVWDSPRVKAILEQPEGSPIDLSGLAAEEINALARDAIGMWADHPYIKDSVQWVRELRKSLYKGIPQK